MTRDLGRRTGEKGKKRKTLQEERSQIHFLPAHVARFCGRTGRVSLKTRRIERSEGKKKESQRDILVRKRLQKNFLEPRSDKRQSKKKKDFEREGGKL